MSLAASAWTTPPTPVPIPGIAIEVKPCASARVNAAFVASATFLAGMDIAGCGIVGAWMMPLKLVRPPDVSTALPTGMGACFLTSASTSDPAARLITPATPPPMMPKLFAAFTMAWASASRMLPWTTLIRSLAALIRSTGLLLLGVAGDALVAELIPRPVLELVKPFPSHLTNLPPAAETKEGVVRNEAALEMIQDLILRLVAVAHGCLPLHRSPSSWSG